MRLDDKHEAEIAKRKGLTIKTILAISWLGLCFAAAYYITDWLFESGTVTYNFFYTRLFIPRSIPEEIIQIGLMVVIVVIVQFFVLVGYAFANPMARRRPGTPTSYSPNPEPESSQYDYRK